MQPTLTAIAKTARGVLVRALACVAVSVPIWVIGVCVECGAVEYHSTQANALVLDSVVNVLTDTAKATYTDEWYDGHIYCEGDVSSYLVSTLEDTEAYLPAGVLDAFVTDGWHITLTSSRDLTAMAESLEADSHGSRTLVGLTEPSTKTIWLVADTSSIIYSTLHEFGHYVDRSLGWASRTEEFQALWDAERGSYAAYNDYAVSSAAEAFANLYGDLLLDAKKGVAAAPACAAYVTRVCGINA